MKLRQHRPEQGRPEQNPGQKLTEQGGLTDPRHALAQRPPDDHQNNQLRKEYCYDVTITHSLRAPTAAPPGPGLTAARRKS